MAVLALGAFTTALNVTLLSPLLTSIAAEFGVTDATAGQLATLTAGASGAMALLVAPWMDRYSRRGWIRFECVVLAIGSVLSAMAPGFGWLVAARVVTGIGGAVIGANCLAALSDLYADAHQRNRAIGLISTSFTLGSVLGLPILTQISDSFGWRWAIASPAPIAMIVIAGSRWLPRTSMVVSGSRWRGWASGYAKILRHRQTVLLLAAMTMLMVVWFGWLIYFGAYAETVFAVSAGTLSLLFLVNGGSQVVSNNIVPFLLRSRPPATIIAFAIAALTLNLLLVGLVYTRVWTVFLFVAIGGAASAVTFLGLSILLLDSLPEARGTVMSLQSAVLEVGGAAGVAMTGLFLSRLDDYEATFRLLGVLAPLVLVFLTIGARRQRKIAAGTTA